MSQSGRGTGSRYHRADRSTSDKGRPLVTFAAYIFCGLVGTLLLLAAAPARAQQFLPILLHSSTVPKNSDLNPYGVAFVPSGFPTNGSKLNPGDILVSNFNNSNNVQGTGTTIISLTPNGEAAPSGTASVFFQGSGLGLTTALGCCNRVLSWSAMSRPKTVHSRRSSPARCCFSIDRAMWYPLPLTPQILMVPGT
jgi:hypothetical protein